MSEANDTVGSILQKKKRSRRKRCDNPILVQHCYHDRANEPPPSLYYGVNTQEFKPPFPVKLYHALFRLEQDGHSDLISWQPHGRCFTIHKPFEFSSSVLPEYFDGLSKLTSFQRQLNLYGFKRITQGRDKGGYYHEYFLRGKLYLVYKIHRIKVKGTGVKGKPNPDQEPDLWSMKWVGVFNDSNIKRKGSCSPVEVITEYTKSEEEISCSNATIVSNETSGSSCSSCNENNDAHVDESDDDAPEDENHSIMEVPQRTFGSAPHSFGTVSQPQEISVLHPEICDSMSSNVEQAQANFACSEPDLWTSSHGDDLISLMLFPDAEAPPSMDVSEISLPEWMSSNANRQATALDVLFNDLKNSYVPPDEVFHEHDRFNSSPKTTLDCNDPLLFYLHELVADSSLCSEI